MSAREEMLAAIRANRPVGLHVLPDMPDPDRREQDLVAAFARALEAMGGRMGREGGIHEFIAALPASVGGKPIVCSVLPEVGGCLELAALTDPHSLKEVDVAVVRAAFGVAETGSVLLVDASIGVNALVYLAQHLVVLLDPADILPNIAVAYRRREFHEHAYASFHTGPSATADIEGVLIHGAQGVRSLTVFLIPRSDDASAAGSSSNDTD